MSLPPLVDEHALQTYLAAQWPGSDAPVRVEKIQAGHSNETFLVARGDEQWVLRRPPRPPYLPTAHDVLREYRVISALAQTAFPVPRPVLVCEDTSVIGAPFYLMERVDGIVFRNTLQGGFAAERDGAAIAGELVRALAALHAVDYQAVGLGSLGRPEGYLARQLKRWTGQLEGAQTRPTPDLDAVTGWLNAHLPESPPATIVHGDFRLDNVIYAPRPPARQILTAERAENAEKNSELHARNFTPRKRAKAKEEISAPSASSAVSSQARIVAVLDWEMSTLGDPLADLGYLLSFWREAGEAAATPLPDDMGDVTSQPGFPTRAEVAARYEELSGRKVDHLTFYIVLAIWKLAILLEGSYKRHLAGTTDDPFFALLAEGVPALARRARAMTG
ncbi:MAG: phosphotransferase family protein [Chloroflexi bacterium]|nr:phosphotransferase family protein [Chloroflexota bacterium]